MTEQEFQARSIEALESLARKLAKASDVHDFESDMNSGALSVEFEEPKAKFVVSPNSPVRQIWVSAHSRSFKLNWDEAKASFVHPDSGFTLDGLIADAISKQIGEPVEL
ncbi:MAG: iron donor protein CyaY [Bryobacteraceae bacterium]